jgi:hypothetical protein
MAKSAQRVRKPAKDELDDLAGSHTPGHRRTAHPEADVRRLAAPGATTAGQLLALQKTAGNRAVVARLARRRAEIAAPVAAPVVPAPGPMAAPVTVQRKPVFNKGKGKWTSDVPALMNQTFVSKAAAEKAEQTARAAPVEAPKALVTVDDGTGAAFEKVKSKEEEQQEARAGVDTAPLIAQIEAHTGRANLMAVPFSQLVNAMEAQGTLAVGAIQEKYYDGAAERAKGADGKWSVAVSIGALRNWEIHAHCDLEGNTARGENAIHIKRTSERYSRGVSIALTPRQEGLLIPPATDRLAARVH